MLKTLEGIFEFRFVNIKVVLTFIVALVLNFQNPVQAQTTNFDKSWQFFKGEAEGAEKVDYDASGWRTLNLPHDWAIEGPFDAKYSGRCGSLPFHGTGWYRKRFKLPQNSEDKIIRIEFEGAMYDAYVWVNGQLVGNRPYGYINFEFDISAYVKHDKDNVIAVRLQPKDFSHRWYPGAGLYRSVWLKIDEPIHVAHWGTYITTPSITKEKATIENATTIVNKSNTLSKVVVQHQYMSPNGKLVSKVEDKLILKPNTSTVSNTWTEIKNPKLWDVKQPNLYSVVTTIIQNEKVVDTYESKIGVRSIAYDANGFYLNGKQIHFNGVCLHHDNGALGTAVNRRAIERKLQILKSMGVNAVQTSHNPASTTFLELCDELGILVVEESFDAWRVAKVENGYNVFFEEWAERDLKDIIRRDRNHPSIIMWSIGNGVKDQGDKKNGWKTAKMLYNFTKEIDKTRPTVIGTNQYPTPFKNNYVQQADIVGLGNKPAMYEEILKANPDMPLFASETNSTSSTRGVYHLPIEKYETHKSLYTTSYDIIAPIWGYPPDIEFHFQEKNPRMMGHFMWAGMDYLGEPIPYGGRNKKTNLWQEHWPAHLAYFGPVDICGFPKDRFYLYQSHWTTKPMIHVLPHWNWAGMEGETIPVYCYTNCDSAELFVNGKSMGVKVKGKDFTEIKVDFVGYEPKTFKSKYRLSWNVPYKAGNIKVVGYKDGKSIVEKQIFTASKPYKVKLSVDRKTIDADGSDLAYVTVRVEDKNGNLCPNANNLVHFSVKGKGQLVAVDNGDQTDVSSFQANQRKAFSGMCLAILKSSEISGEIKLTATSKGLKSDKVIVTTK